MMIRKGKSKILRKKPDSVLLLPPPISHELSPE
jgi:hypothetical protein